MGTPNKARQQNNRLNLSLFLGSLLLPTTTRTKETSPSPSLATVPVVLLKDCLFILGLVVGATPSSHHFFPTLRALVKEGAVALLLDARNARRYRHLWLRRSGDGPRCGALGRGPSRDWFSRRSSCRGNTDGWECGGCLGGGNARRG